MSTPERYRREIEAPTLCDVETLLMLMQMKATLRPLADAMQACVHAHLHA